MGDPLDPPIGNNKAFLAGLTGKKKVVLPTADKVHSLERVIVKDSGLQADHTVKHICNPGPDDVIRKPSYQWVLG